GALSGAVLRHPARLGALRTLAGDRRASEARRPRVVAGCDAHQPDGVPALLDVWRSLGPDLLLLPDRHRGGAGPALQAGAATAADGEDRVRMSASEAMAIAPGTGVSDWSGQAGPPTGAGEPFSGFLASIGHRVLSGAGAY